MKIGNTEIKNNLILGPMAGVADMAFRELCVNFGAGFVVGEMVSAKGFTMGDRKSAELLRISEKERPAAIQLFGTSPLTMAEAAKKCLEFELDAIDINMGCPAPKVVNTGAGSALMKDLPLAKEIITDLHGEEEYNHALNLSEALFSGNIKDFNSKDIESVFKGMPIFKGENKNLVETLVDNKICSSKREAREFIGNGAISVNGDKVTDLDYLVSKDKSIDNKYTVIRRGKKKYFIISF